jgi:hypothetical protein
MPEPLLGSAIGVFPSANDLEMQYRQEIGSIVISTLLLELNFSLWRHNLLTPILCRCLTQGLLEKASKVLFVFETALTSDFFYR